MNIIFQNSQKYSQKGLLVSLFSYFMVKFVFLQKNQIDWWTLAEMGQKLDFGAF